MHCSAVQELRPAHLVIQVLPDLANLRYDFEPRSSERNRLIAHFKDHEDICIG